MIPRQSLERQGLIFKVLIPLCLSLELSSIHSFQQPPKLHAKNLGVMIDGDEG
jgi:hypothetical protein